MAPCLPLSFLHQNGDAEKKTVLPEKNSAAALSRGLSLKL